MDERTTTVQWTQAAETILARFEERRGPQLTAAVRAAVLAVTQVMGWEVVMAGSVQQAILMVESLEPIAF